MAAKETITRRDLPHWYVPGAFHFVTYRLYGTLPKVKLDELRAHKEVLLKRRPGAGQAPAQHRTAVHKQLFAMYDDWLDEASGGSQWLQEPRVAAMIRANLYHHHSSKYHLLAYCIMPNHVHALFQPIDATSRGAGGPPAAEQASRLYHEPEIGEVSDSLSPLSSIMHSLKSYTAHEANKILGREGAFWQSESYDHWVRNEDELDRIVLYVAHNPVKAGLVKNPHEWFFCSAHDRFLADGQLEGWLRCRV